MATISTPLTKLFGIKHPILLAGMNVAAGPDLAAAVTRAGGLGVIGGLSYTPKLLREAIHELKDQLVDKSGRFGVDLALPQVGGTARKTNHDYTHGKLPELIDIIIEEKASLFVCAVGVPPVWVCEKLHANGILVANMVGAPKHVAKALERGVDIVIPQGSHTGDISTAILIPACVEAVKGKKSPLTGDQILVIAAGGIHDGKCAEEAGAPKVHQEAVISAGHSDTVRTLIYSGRPLRVKNTPYVKNWESRPDEIADLTSRGILPYTTDADTTEEDSQGFLMGQVCAMIHSVEPASKIVETMVAEASDMEAENFYDHHATATASLKQLVDAHRLTEASEKALKLKVSKLEAEREVWREDAWRSDALVKDRNAKLEILTLKLGQLGKMGEVSDGHAQIIDSEDKLTHFFQGFTSSRSLFTMVRAPPPQLKNDDGLRVYLQVDIGERRDVAETKILDTIGFWARLPSTERVFAGCAPNSGYISLLNSLIEDNRADGVSLLKSTSSAVSNPHLDSLKTTTMIGMFERQKFNIIPLPSPSSPTSPLSRPFSSVLASNPTPTADARSSSSNGATSEYFKSFRKTNLRTRPIDPSKPLTKQVPPPCNWAYLTKNGCYNQKCQRAHDYDLSSDQIEQLRRSVKNQPCRFRKHLRGRCAGQYRY
ncbi:hypothetical protein RQP46_004451 [Phenoliferia psychrophenolica]